jgi:hypothetical protein
MVLAVTDVKYFNRLLARKRQSHLNHFTRRCVGAAIIKFSLQAASKFGPNGDGRATRWALRLPFLDSHVLAATMDDAAADPPPQNASGRGERQTVIATHAECLGLGRGSVISRPRILLSADAIHLFAFPHSEQQFTKKRFIRRISCGERPAGEVRSIGGEDAEAVPLEVCAAHRQRNHHSSWATRTFFGDCMLVVLVS